MKPLITFVNHASVIFSHGGVNLITDPWIHGSAFNNSWELTSKSKMKIEDFNKITHIWFSHEHPDHFSPKILELIPLETRKKITVLFQDTLDHRVAKKCKQLEFNVIELKNGKAYELAENFKVICRPYLLYDSWLFLHIENFKILNLNDCGVDSKTQAKYISDEIGSVDLLLTQFGYAAHIGDPNDHELRKIASAEKLDRIKIQSETFHARYIIPYASFVRFSHVDNAYMNDQMNDISTVENYISKNTDSKPIILFPGDEWNISEKHDNTNALRLYKTDSLEKYELFDKSPKISINVLKISAKKYLDRIHQKNNLTSIYLLDKIKFFKTAKIYLKDLDLTVKFNIINGIEESVFSKDLADIITDSDSLEFAFKFDYGADTLLANARFRTSGGRTMNFFRLFMIGTLNNNGRTFPLGIIGFLLREKSMWKTLFIEAILGKYEFK